MMNITMMSMYHFKIIWSTFKTIITIIIVKYAYSCKIAIIPTSVIYSCVYIFLLQQLLIHIAIIMNTVEIIIYYDEYKIV